MNYNIFIKHINKRNKILITNEYILFLLIVSTLFGFLLENILFIILFKIDLVITNNFI